MHDRLRELQCIVPAGAGAPMTPAMRLALEANFGSVERWHTRFNAPGAGAAVLSFQPRSGALVNHRVSGEGEMLVDLVPLLALEAAAPVETIDWAQVHAHYQHAVHVASEPHGVGIDELEGVALIDVRRAGVFEQASTHLPGAQWRDPAAVGTWAATLPRDQSLVVYCVYGHEVGRATALRLRSLGLSAHFLRGGIDAWQAAGRPLEPKNPPP